MLSTIGLVINQSLVLKIRFDCCKFKELNQALQNDNLHFLGSTVYVEALTNFQFSRSNLSFIVCESGSQTVNLPVGIVGLSWSS